MAVYFFLPIAVLFDFGLFLQFQLKQQKREREEDKQSTIKK